MNNLDNIVEEEMREHDMRCDKNEGHTVAYFIAVHVSIGQQLKFRFNILF